jgi:hypothetical protein
LLGTIPDDARRRGRAAGVTEAQRRGTPCGLTLMAAGPLERRHVEREWSEIAIEGDEP